MSSQIKWQDPEDLKIHGEEITRNIHKKLTKKHNNLSEALHSYKKEKIGSNKNFLAWTQKKFDPKMSKIDQLLVTSKITNKALSKTSIKKILETDSFDSLRSVV